MQNDIPSAFVCPITREIMRDPVIAPNGTTFDRSAITLWLSTRKTHPLTKEDLNISQLVPNRALKEAIDKYLENEESEVTKRDLTIAELQTISSIACSINENLVNISQSLLKFITKHLNDDKSAKLQWAIANSTLNEFEYYKREKGKCYIHEKPAALKSGLMVRKILFSFLKGCPMTLNSLKVSFTLCPSYNEHYNHIKFKSNSTEKAIGSYWKLNDNYHKIFSTSLDAHYEAGIIILTMNRSCKIC